MNRNEQQTLAREVMRPRLRIDNIGAIAVAAILVVAVGG